MSSALARVRAAKAALKESQELKAAGIRVISTAEQKKREFCRINLTFLLIILQSEEKIEVFCDSYITRYADLQREIARVTPGKNGIFVIQAPNGEFISSGNFRPEHYYKVKEIPRHNIPIIYPLVPAKWEFKRYHGAPRDWIDPLEAIRLAEEARLKAEAGRIAAEELRLKLAADEEKRRDVERAALIGDDQDWDDMLDV
jgi:hypothetical protein